MTGERPLLPHPGPEHYTDPALLDVERRQIFTDNWVGIGAASKLQKPGDVCPLEVAGQPLLVTRDQDGRLHIFFNVCRHRGLKLIDAACHRANGLITCPYHTWSYSLDGELRAAPYWDRSAGSAPDELTRNDLRLKAVRHVVWYDTIFVNLSGTAQPFDTFVAPLAERWAGFDANDLRLLVAKEYHPRANWKLVCENFLDGYHLPFVHGQVGGPSAGADYVTVGLSVDCFGAFVPGGESERPRINRPLPSFPNVPKKFRSSHHFIYLFPNTLLAIGEQWFQAICVLPGAVNESFESLGLYLVSDEAMADDRANQRREFERQMLRINEQDLEILAQLQIGRASNAGADSNYAPYWDELAVMLHRRLAGVSG